MIRLDRNALICDLAEEYQIYDMRSLPVHLVATLSVGLRDDSRIKRQLCGVKYSATEIILAQIADRISGVIWLLGGYGDAEQPPSLVDAMLNGLPEKKDSGFKQYSSADEFLAAWNK